jgi:hypothetical protein
MPRLQRGCEGLRARLGRGCPGWCAGGYRPVAPATGSTTHVSTLAAHSARERLTPHFERRGPGLVNINVVPDDHADPFRRVSGLVQGRGCFGLVGFQVKRELLDLVKERGWGFRVDLAGIPYGWAASRNRRRGRPISHQTGVTPPSSGKNGRVSWGALGDRDRDSGKDRAPRRAQLGSPSPLGSGTVTNVT